MLAFPAPRGIKANEEKLELRETPAILEYKVSKVNLVFKAFKGYKV